MNILGVDPKDVIIEDMKRTLRDIERTLRNAGTPMAVWDTIVSKMKTWWNK